MNVFRTVRDRSHNRHAAYQGNTDGLLWRLADVAYRTWDLGFTAFGGPPVHFQIWRRRFVEGVGGSAWVDERTVRWRADAVVHFSERLIRKDCMVWIAFADRNWRSF